MTRCNWTTGCELTPCNRARNEQVEDDPSVEACRVGVRKSATLNMSMCLEHFLEREQLDETDMWYCSNCKVLVLLEVFPICLILYCCCTHRPLGLR